MGRGAGVSVCVMAADALWLYFPVYLWYNGYKMLLGVNILPEWYAKLDYILSAPIPGIVWLFFLYILWTLAVMFEGPLVKILEFFFPDDNRNHNTTGNPWDHM